MTPKAKYFAETVLLNTYLPHRPTTKQALFLLDPHLEVLFGGAAGGGKSDALLMAALQFVEWPGYAALLLRRTYADLALPGALMDRAQTWLRNTAAKWNDAEKTWRFPSGATLTFGYLDSRHDHLRYQSSEFQFIGFDELTQFDEGAYRFLFSRLRRLADSPVPLRMRSASNPGGPGHEWVRRRFLDSKHTDRVFVPAGLVDNPHLDQEGYAAALAHLDPLTRARLLRGDWTARGEGALFRREWFQVEDEAPNEMHLARWWDLSAGGDYSVGLRLGRDPLGRYWVLDVKRVRAPSAQVEDLVRRTAEEDGPGTLVLFGEEPGSAGKALTSHYQRNVIPTVRVEGVRETGPKWVRAQPVAGQAQAGNVRLLRGAWIDEFLDELEAFSEDERSYAHDDQVDALSGAYGVLAARGGFGSWLGGGRGGDDRRKADAEIEAVFGRQGGGDLESFLASRGGGFFGS